MHSIIFTAHPSKRGFTHRIARYYKKSFERGVGTCEIIDLYDDRWYQDYLKFESVSDIKVDGVRDESQGKISSADEIVFVFPVWWGDAPAKMKNFFDSNFSSGFAFEYDKKGKAIGLLSGKKARMFLTCDGSAFFYKFLIVRLSWLWGMGRLGFCGVKLLSLDILGNKRHRNEKELDAFLSLVERRASD